MKNFDKKYLGAFFAGILWGGVIVFIAGVLYLRSNLIVEYKSKYDSKKTAETICKAVSQSKSGWSVRREPCALPLIKEAEGVTLLKLCNKKYAEMMLDNPCDRKASAIIPCSFAVYSKNGETCVARLNIKLVGMLLGGMPSTLFRGCISGEQNEMLDKVIEK